MVDLSLYQKFVTAVTSEESKHNYAFTERFDELSQHQEDKTVIHPALLLTAGIGLASETGEFNEIIKKMFFQGKPLNAENLFHMKRELGDICWYIAQACMALDTSFDEILQMNYEKLSARYPEGAFDVYRSENRVEGDL